MKISISVMAHPSRGFEANKLLDQLTDMPFNFVACIMDRNNDEWTNGVENWRQAYGSDWHIVIQDDAIISKNFYKNVEKALKNVPKPGILSFYTGTVKPHQNSVKTAVAKADALGHSYLRCKWLLWGVCVAIPTSDIELLLNEAEYRKDLYDMRIGLAAEKLGMPVYYTNPSIVDHNDDIPSLTGHKVAKKRVAHRYEPEIIKEWNSNFITIF